jgi:hypothetical protein
MFARSSTARGSTLLAAIVVVKLNCSPATARATDAELWSVSGGAPKPTVGLGGASGCGITVGVAVSDWARAN